MELESALNIIVTRVKIYKFDLLDDHLIFRIVSFLNIYETNLILVFLLSRNRSTQIKADERFYKAMCIANLFEHPLITEKKPIETSYSQYFKQSLSVASSLKKSYELLIQSVHSTPGRSFFRDIQIEKAFKSDNQNRTSKLANILKIVKSCYGSISRDFLLFYRILNGQSELGNFSQKFIESVGLFGYYQYYETEQLFYFDKFSPPLCGFLENLKAHPFAIIYPIKKRIYADVTNQLGFGYQSLFIFYPVHTNNPNLHYLYIAHSSINSFMLKLQSSNFDGEQIQLIDTINQPASDTQTDGIRIRVTAKQCENFIGRAPIKHSFVDPNNSLDSFFYTYHVRISTAINFPINKRFRLTTRKWICVNNEHPDNPELIEGPGVIGQYPEVYAGCEDFVYESCSLVNGYIGQMSGSFKFVEINTGEQIEAFINPFPLCPDSDARLISFNSTSKVISQVYPISHSS